tara:strand:- start:973 stop:1983 length:1011 start_codon:yes stop_codon:yes gene_type:complete
LKIFNKNTEKDILFIAEIGVNHEGSLDVAKDLIHKAAFAGADAVKFQSYTPEKFISSVDHERMKRIKKFSLTKENHIELISTAKECNINFFSSAITEDWIPFLEENCEVIKIASGDLTFEPTLIAAATSKCKLILSTGLGTISEIDRAIEVIKQNTTETNLSSKIALLHCISAYPTPIEEANILSIPFLKERYNLEVGFSNHIVGIEASLAAIANGAKLIEIHFTDNKHNRTFHDHALSADPEDLKLLVDMGKKIHLSLGKYEKIRQNSEIPNVNTIRKGIIAAKSLNKNTVLMRSDIMFARPASFFSAKDVGELIGKKLNKSLKTGEPIKPEDLE